MSSRPASADHPFPSVLVLLAMLLLLSATTPRDAEAGPVGAGLDGTLSAGIARVERLPARTCDLIGLWRADQGEGAVRFRREGDVIVGRVVEAPRDDVAVGFAMLYELRWVEADARYEGWLARSEDSILPAEITCPSSEHIVVRGKIGFLGRSFGWIRVADPGAPR